MEKGDWWALVGVVVIVGIVGGCIVAAIRESNRVEAQTTACIRYGYATSKEWLDVVLCIGYTDGTIRIAPLAELACGPVQPWMQAAPGEAE